MASLVYLAALFTAASAVAINPFHVDAVPTAASGNVLATAATCTGPVASTPSTFWIDQMNHTGAARGYAPELNGYYNYPVYRNVMSSTYGAVNDGSGDQTKALQNAMNDDGQGGNRYSDSGYTIRPAEVYIPSGTYVGYFPHFYRLILKLRVVKQICSQLDLRIGTILVGDPLNPPTIKACAGFTGTTLINGRDAKAGDPTTVFFIAVKVSNYSTRP
jgi:glucan 1,3-beta-glucosidase